MIHQSSGERGSGTPETHPRLMRRTSINGLRRLPHREKRVARVRRQAEALSVCFVIFSLVTYVFSISISRPTQTKGAEGKLLWTGRKTLKKSTFHFDFFLFSINAHFWVSHRIRCFECLCLFLSWVCHYPGSQWFITWSTNNLNGSEELFRAVHSK